MEMLKTKKKIERLYESFSKKEEQVREEIRKVLSAFLMDTDKNHPYDCNITLDIKEGFGLSSVYLPKVTSMWQHPTEGYISICYEGSGVCDFDFVPTEELYLIIKEILEL